MALFDRIKKFIGTDKHSPYINGYFDKSNIRSAVYVSSVIIILEVFMIINISIRQFFEETRRTDEWFIVHISCFSVLLLTAIVLFIYSICHIKKLGSNRRIWELLKYVFSIVALVFGIYISYLDYQKGEQFITLMTMTIFVFSFVVWRPIYSFLLLSVTYAVFFWLCNRFTPATFASKINLFIVFISLLMSAINAYHQKLKEAEKGEKLNHAHDILLKLSISDEVTGIANMHYFRSQALDLLHDNSVEVNNLIFLFLDIENFKTVNEKYGFWEGNDFLKEFADMLNKVFKNSIVAHFSNDNFLCTLFLHPQK